MRPRFVPFAFAALLAGCGLTVVGSSPFRGDGDPGGVGGPVAPGASDGGSLPDGGTPNDDAATDSGTGGALGWCQEHPGHQTCADFDEGTVAPLTLSVLAGNPSTLDPGVSRSPPSSLLSSGSTAGTTTYAYRGWDSALPSTVDLAFDALATGTGPVQFGGIELTLPGGGGITQLVFEANEIAGDITFLVLGPSMNVRTTSSLSSSGWRHYEIHLAIGNGADSSRITARVDGVSVEPNSGVLVGSYQSSKSLKALVGLYYLGVATSASVNVDNVTIDGT